MDFRLYIDEVGNGDLKGAAANPNIRYLSLTGILTTWEKHTDVIQPEIDRLKSDLFGHSPDNPVILHRREIMRREPPFHALRDEGIRGEFDERILSLIRCLPYLAITVIIDKKQHLDLYDVFHYNPYHYCLCCIVERYMLYLNSHGWRGDVVIEARSPTLDKKLKASYQFIYDRGTQYVKGSLAQKILLSRDTGLKTKKSNVAGLQLADMLAQSSERHMRRAREGVAQPVDFGSRIADILIDHKYRRHPKTMAIDGYGRKWLP